MNRADDRKDVCFLVGAPRSGTTWIQRLLQSHPQICGGEESHFFTLFSAPIGNAQRIGDPARRRRIGPLSYVSQDEFEDLVRDLWDGLFKHLYAENPDCHVHLEKTPFHALNLERIVQIFPAARIIFLVRDSRPTVSSMVHAGRGWGDYWAPDNYRDAALEWHRHVKAVRDWRTRHPEHPFLQVRYEDVLDDTHGELERMLRFLLPDTEDLQRDKTLQAFEAGGADSQDPAGFARQRGAVGWKDDMSAYGKFVTWRFTRKLMREFGYDISIFD